MKTKCSLLVLAIVALISVRSTMGFEKIYYIDTDSTAQSKFFGNYYQMGGNVGDQLWVGGWGDIYESLIKMPIRFPVPGRTLINGASLNLYSINWRGTPTTMQKIFWINPWSQFSTTDHWNISGYYFGQVPAPSYSGWYSMDISSEYWYWLMGIYNNYGIGLLPEHNDNRFNIFASTRYHDVTKRPFIAVRYEEIPDFKMPLPGGVGWKLTVECGGKTFDRNPVTDSSHTGRGYYSLDFSPYWIPLSGGVPQLATDVPIYAAAGGKVIGDNYPPNDPNSPNGNHVKIDHDYDGNPETGFQTVYLHLKYAPSVTIGNVVHQGQLLGIMGNTGQSYGTHLHVSFYFQNTSGPNGSDSAQLNFTTMESWPLTEFKINTLWRTDLSPNQYDPAFYPSSNSVQ
jgi:hypothetical protein